MDLSTYSWYIIIVSTTSYTYFFLQLFLLLLIAITTSSYSYTYFFLYLLFSFAFQVRLKTCLWHACVYFIIGLLHRMKGTRTHDMFQLQGKYAYQYGCKLISSHGSKFRCNLISFVNPYLAGVKYRTPYGPFSTSHFTWISVFKI